MKQNLEYLLYIILGFLMVATAVFIGHHLAKKHNEKTVVEKTENVGTIIPLNEIQTKKEKVVQ